MNRSNVYRKLPELQNYESYESEKVFLRIAQKNLLQFTHSMKQGISHAMHVSLGCGICGVCLHDVFIIICSYDTNQTNIEIWTTKNDYVVPSDL